MSRVHASRCAKKQKVGDTELRGNRVKVTRASLSFKHQPSLGSRWDSLDGCLSYSVRGLSTNFVNHLEVIMVDLSEPRRFGFGKYTSGLECNVDATFGNRVEVVWLRVPQGSMLPKLSVRV